MNSDVVTVQLIDELRAVCWSGGVFAGDGALVAAATALAAAGAQIEVAPPGGYVRADSTTRAGAAAAMLGAARGRGIVVQQDPTLWRELGVGSDGTSGIIH
ncbi:hypothetical protein [Nocardia sp. NPDC052566]|uniref:hypothetical protein n=1 Tax=Nocardia sp. NPDC052566 TaxID=3364330 RepID=UPI0037C996EC